MRSSGRNVASSLRLTEVGSEGPLDALGVADLPLSAAARSPRPDLGAAHPEGSCRFRVNSTGDHARPALSSHLSIKLPPRSIARVHRINHAHCVASLRRREPT